MKSVLGLGNALVDIMIPLQDDDLLDKFKLKKGSMQLVNKNFITELLNTAENLDKELASGGSAANTVHGLATLGVKAGYIGKTGKDFYGDFFCNDMNNAGINPCIQKSNTESGIAVALVTKDSERTFATCLGAAVELCADDLQNEMFSHYNFFHIEGYLVQNYELILKALKLARQNNVTISLDLASFNVIEQHNEFLHSIVRDYVDIVFANEEEAKTFTGFEPEKAVNEISSMCDIAIVKKGKNGSLVKTKNELFHINAISANCIDTTGAGDLYASGFLFGLVNEYSIDICGNIGSLLGGNVIEVIGAKMKTDRWNIIKENISKILSS